VELSRRYARHFEANGGRVLREQVSFIDAGADRVRVQTLLQRIDFDHLVVAVGVASKRLAAQLGVKIPLMSERGYHLTLDAGGKRLNRPVGWLGNAVFLTPMEGGIRLAGTAEFADADAPPSRERTDCMLNHACTLLEPFLDAARELEGEGSRRSPAGAGCWPCSSARSPMR